MEEKNSTVSGLPVLKEAGDGRSSLHGYKGLCVCVCVCVCVCACSVDQSHPTLYNPMDCSPWAPQSMEFSSQEYWSGLPFPTLGEIPDPGIKFEFLASPA